jgi:hypothetical protein
MSGIRAIGRDSSLQQLRPQSAFGHGESWKFAAGMELENCLT